MDGIVVLDEENGTFTPYLGPDGANPINGYSRIIYEGADLTLWVGTDKGLFEIDRDQQEITFYSTDSHDDRNKNLSNERVYEIYDSKDGKIWIGTNSGLYIYPEENQPKSKPLYPIQSNINFIFQEIAP